MNQPQIHEAEARRMKTPPIAPDEDNIVERAIQLGGGSMVILAERLERLTGMKCTKQKIWNWKERGQISVDWVWAVHHLTRIPMKDLLKRPRPRGGKAE